MAMMTKSESQTQTTALEYIKAAEQLKEITQSIQKLEDDRKRVEGHRTARAADLGKLVGSAVSRKCLRAGDYTIVITSRFSKEKQGATITLDTYDADGKHWLWDVLNTVDT